MDHHAEVVFRVAPRSQSGASPLVRRSEFGVEAVGPAARVSPNHRRTGAEMTGLPAQLLS
jgi:hypothetical protein